MGSNGKDWDQLSMYSTRSIPRARMYHHGDQHGRPGSVNGGFIPDDARSHASGSNVNLMRSRSLIDGQVLQPNGRSVSALSGRGATYLPPGLHHQFAGAGFSGLHGMAGLSGSMSAMAGLPTALSGLGLSRAGNKSGGSKHKSGCKKAAPKTDNKKATTKTTTTTEATNGGDEATPATSTETLTSTQA